MFLNTVKFLIWGLTLFFPHILFSQERPNVILFIADDVSWDDFGCYGNKFVKTPNIDQLASEGLTFMNAFLTASSCSPSRCSIISGKYPHSNGAAELHTPLPEEHIPFPLLLKEQGYYTAQAGKWHMGTSPHKAFYKFTDIDTDPSAKSNGDGGEDNWLPYLRDRPKDKPFFFWFASHDAHRLWGADDFMVQHDPDSIEVPPYFADTPETRRDMASYYNEIARFDYFIGKVRDELKMQGELENTLIIIMADNGRPFPRCKTRVYDSGMKTPFVVHWPAGIKEDNTKPEGLISAIDVAPTILELAGVTVPSDYQGKSFVPILKDPSVETREAIYAEHNWHDYEAYERMVRTKEYLYVLNRRPNFTNCGPIDSNQSPTHEALRELRDKGELNAAQADVFISPRPLEELFDLTQDPDQLVNVVSSDRYKDQLYEMRNSLLSWSKETKDEEPLNLTPDWYDRETGKALDIKGLRGDMPDGKIQRK